jgi:hypothetical protein
MIPLDLDREDLIWSFGFPVFQWGQFDRNSMTLMRDRSQILRRQRKNVSRQTDPVLR